MSFHIFKRDGVIFRGRDTGQGPGLLFQHGLTGDEAQVADVAPVQGFRRLTLECRAHGTSTAGSSKTFSIPQFADDVLAFADSRGVEKFVVGGISMGAAIALRIAVVAPQRVQALVLARPAWTWQAAPDNMQVFQEIADFAEKADPEGFSKSATAKHFKKHAPDNLASFLKIFDRADLPTTAELLRHISASGPDVTKAQVKAIKVATLVLANKADLVHPMAHAETLATTIPHAIFIELAPKATQRELHLNQFRQALNDFLQQQGNKQ
jgi:pimeloyl-ACP methyl ester carboxylesterase